MSIDENTIICIHGNGFACDSCYDQTFGAKWKPENLTDMLMGDVPINLEPSEYRHPFLEVITDYD